MHKQISQIETIRQTTILAMEELGYVSVQVTALFSDTLEKKEDLNYEHGLAKTAQDQWKIPRLTYEYSKTLNEILKAHRKSVFRELERHENLLERNNQA